MNTQDTFVTHLFRSIFDTYVPTTKHFSIDFIENISATSGGSTTFEYTYDDVYINMYITNQVSVVDGTNYIRYEIKFSVLVDGKLVYKT